MNIVLIGPSGSGKGTHAQRLADEFDFHYLSTGDLLRANLEANTPLGHTARRYMQEGEFVPDELVDSMMEEWLRTTTAEEKILFDGFPRTLYQARFLDGLFKQMGRTLHRAIYLRASEEAVLKRLAARWICASCQLPFNTLYNRFDACPFNKCQGEHLYQRLDDTPAMVRARFRVFQRNAQPLLRFYEETARLVTIESEEDIEQVYQNLTHAIHSAEPAAELAASPPAFVAGAPAAAAVEVAERGGLDLVLLGGPGSGKGTQAEQLADHFHVPHIATGDLFRENLKNETELGRFAKAYMDRGELVPDDITEAMVQERLARSDTEAGFILDGFPRTLPQAAALEEILAELRRLLSGVLYIKVSDEEIVRRLSGRLICRNCQAPYHREFKPPAREGICDSCGGPLYQRDDDNSQTVRARLKTFHGQTEPLIDFYRRDVLLIEIDGEGGVARVFESARDAAESLTSSAIRERRPLRSKQQS